MASIAPGRSRTQAAATNPCPKCGRPTRYGFPVCWRCHVHDQVEEARHAGYAEGHAAGYTDGRAVQRAQVLDVHRLRQLLQLCHPDKHGGSLAANEVTAWLLQQRDSCTKSRVG